MPPKAETQATEARRGASWLQLLAAAAAGAALCSSALLAHDAGRRPSMSIVDRELLAGSIFVGHLAPDMDSVAAAVASAELYVGTAAVASNLNRSRPSLPRPSVARAPHRLRPPKSHTLWVIRCPTTLQRIEMGYAVLEGVIARTGGPGDCSPRKDSGKGASVPGGFSADNADAPRDQRVLRCRGH